MKYFLVICAFFFTSTVSHAEHILSGRVINTKGIALSGVTVSADDNTGAVISGAEGDFALQLNNLPTTVTFYLPNHSISKSTITSIQDDIEVVLNTDESEYVAYGKQDLFNFW